MRPRRVQFPIAGCLHGFVLNLRVAAFQGLQYLVVKTANPSHRKYGRQQPLPVSAGIRATDRVLMPILRRTHRCFQNPAPHLLGNALIRVKFVQHTSNAMKGGRADRHIVGILEFVRICLFEICLFEDWAKGNRRRGAQLF